MNDRRQAGGLLGRLRQRKPEPPETGGEQPTLALAPLLDWLGRRRNARVVDLGPAHGDNLSFLSRYGCRIEFLDLYSQIWEAGQTNPHAELERTQRLVEHMLELGAPEQDATGHGEVGSDAASGSSGARRRRESIDLILFWDLINYMIPSQIEGLYRALSPLLASGTRAFLLLAHSPELPLHPRRLRFAGRDRLIWDEQAPAVRPCPQYSEHRLHKMFPDFTVDRSFLMRHGVREYLLAIPETREQSVVQRF
ncbi:MAG TPA: methyltransferase domain-containing protein [Thermoanaerobaculia bacterium]|nr:methyltransferase domain-containing protein [Thermoanaerobaculia bacterium]